MVAAFLRLLDFDADFLAALAAFLAALVAILA